MKNLPKKVDLQKMLKDVPVHDQGELSNSTACTIATAFALKQQQKNKK